MDFLGRIYLMLSVCISLFFVLPGVEAADEGNVIAVLLGLVLTGICCCACLGYYARSRDGQP
ncbi:small integral membrane protein 30 [Rana temporaria]|uniref:small integral membrane protein 30 n=1 Tax=Rana temporaria TaxID=8407 RepID=UPI001AAC9D62|nr:small integral membrane protein 30 [Rana temporaria]XP_040199740.1 small integral membrane protein 30 [Rana temporaria]